MVVYTKVNLPPTCFSKKNVIKNNPDVKLKRILILMSITCYSWKKKYCLYPHFKEHKGSIYLCFTDTHEKVCASLEFQLSIQSIQISPWTVNSPCSLEVSFISLVPHLVEVLGIRVSEALWRLNGWFSNWKVSKPLSVDCHVCWPNTEAFLCIFSQKLSDCYPTSD